MYLKMLEKHQGLLDLGRSQYHSNQKLSQIFCINSDQYNLTKLCHFIRFVEKSIVEKRIDSSVSICVCQNAPNLLLNVLFFKF